ncbi:MAG: carboxypeptidase-like regulatory domain-containing protein [Bacteroidales bacterium]|nr:carboxypeptidase-like regulatory domain-containing protein [Bacteroidales bacterium]
MTGKKIAILLSLFTLLQLLPSASSYGQTGSNREAINITCHKKTLRHVLDQITNQSGVLFVYNADLIDDQSIIDIKIRNTAINTALDQITDLLGLEYTRIEKQIILKPRQKNISTTDSYDNSRTISINGYVRDHDTHEPLIGATISVEGQPLGTVSNGIGYYTLTLRKGEYTLIYSYLGYRREYVKTNPTSNLTINQELESTEQQVEAVAITYSKTQPTTKHLLNRSSSLNVTDFYKYSGLVFGGDLVGILATDHGITRLSDGSAFYSVRGGYKDQNLVLIDEAPIYHPSHFFGLYSSVAPQSINSLEVYTSDFPLKYGGRLSSITDIRTKDGSLGKFGISSEITPLTLSSRLEIPIHKDRITATANIRKSILGWVMKALDIDGDFSFYDIHSKIHFKISPKDRLYISVFNGTDYYSNLDMGNNYAVTWNNIAATVRHYHTLGARHYMNQSAYFGQYKYLIYTNEDHSNYWNTHIGNMAYKADFVWETTPLITIRYGGEYSYHIFVPATLYINKEKSNSGLLTGNATNIVAYAGTEVQATKNIAIKAGARVSVWQNYGPAKSYYYNETLRTWDTTSYGHGRFNKYVRIEPRVAVVYRATPRLDLKVSAERNVQYLHMLSNSISPFTTLDLWIPSGNYFRPQDVIATTFSTTARIWDMTITGCAYYKYFKNLTEYRLHANMLMNRTIENEFYLGKAKSVGLEFSTEKNVGKIRMKANYSYTYSHKYTPELYKKEYIPDNNIPHCIHLMTLYNITTRLAAKVDWNFNSGIPYTKPVGFYYYDNYKIPYYGDRNNARLPDYHKLNIAVEYSFAKPRIKNLAHKISLSVYNIYNRHNYVLVSYNKIRTQNNKFMIPSNYTKDNHFVPTGMSLPGTMLMVSYRVQYQR